MAWEQLSESDKAWIAGIYEGEGSIYVYKGSGEIAKYVRLFFFNNDETMLEEVQRLIGGHLHLRVHRRQEDWAESHQLQFGKKEDIIKFKELIYPYMRSEYKKDQFNESINHANTNGGTY